jgi:hypothetical protein
MTVFSGVRQPINCVRSYWNVRLVSGYRRLRRSETSCRAADVNANGALTGVGREVPPSCNNAES